MARTDIPLQEKAIVEEVVEDLTTHQDNTSNFLNEREHFLDMYNGVPMLLHNRHNNSRTQDYEGFSRIAAPTTLESVETLTNAIYTMMTSADPNFEMISMANKLDPSLIYKLTHLLRFQDLKTKFRPKLMKAVRSLVLNGTVFVEKPWVSFPSGDNDPMWEGTDFIVRPFTQMFWSNSVTDLDNVDFMGTIDAVSVAQLRNLAGMDAEGVTWISENIEKAVKDDESQESIDQLVKSRLNKLGYNEFRGLNELILRWGSLQSMPDRKEYCVGVLNRKHLVRFHLSPFSGGVKPFITAHHIQTENGPLAQGVGHQMKDLQRYINSFLNRGSDVVTFNVMSQFFVNQFSTLKTNKLKIKPWQFIPIDDVNAVKQITSDPNAANMAIQFYNLMVELARNSTGATPTLQAVITEASASEVRLAQNNSMRRIANSAEIAAEDLLRKHYLFNHQNNGRFLDRPLPFRMVGMKRTEVIFPTDAKAQVDIIPKLVTDKDFAPAMLKNSMQLLQILTSIRNMIPSNINIEPIVGEVVRRLGVDPSTVFSPKPAAPQVDPRVLQGLLSRERANAGGARPSGAESGILAQRGINAINAIR